VVNEGGGEEEMNEHSEEQGLRVHHLVNLGGLLAVAGLDREPPDFLRGALISVAHEREALTPEQRARVASLGREKLDERATAKRAWKSWRRSQDLHSLMLSSAQIRRLIVALGGAAPENTASLAETLTGLLGEAGDAAVAIAAR
jgi:hypothetical protein